MSLFGLNKEELLWGFIYGICFIFFMGWWAIPVSIVSAILWALGGRYGHSIRVFGVPIVVYGVLFLVTKHLSCITSGILTGLTLSIGYGQVTFDSGMNIIDEGSALGRFWYGISTKYSNILTRGTIVLLLILSFIPSLF